MLNVTLAIHEAERRTAAVVGLPIERLPEEIPIAFQERTLSLWAISMGKQRTESASAAGLQAPESARNLSFHVRTHQGTLPIYLAETLADVRFRDSGVGCRMTSGRCEESVGHFLDSKGVSAPPVS
jgi:hypothetical protein